MDHHGLGYSLEKHPLRYRSLKEHRNFSGFCNILAPRRSTKISGGFTIEILGRPWASEFSMEADCFFGQLKKNQWLEPKTLHVQHAGYFVQSQRFLGGFHL